MTDLDEKLALQLSERALEEPESKRDSWLQTACGENAALLARVQQLLENIGATNHNTYLGLTAELYSNARPPEMLGPYRVGELIGQGGMGAVYRAERSDGAYERTVAIKLVGRILSSSDAEARFTNERQILAKMQHPNITALLDGGTENERGYLVMEYVEGKPFDYDPNRSVADTLSAFKKVCAAVQYAHNNLVLHRDLKPDNVLIDPQGEPKLLDFGIAKLNQDLSEADSADLTGTNAIPMTMNYSAPERLLGETATVSSEVYSLGVYLFVLLKGARPYDLSGKTLPEAWKLVDSREQEELSSSASDLDRIAGKAMHKDPLLRYASAAELATDIKRYENGQPVSARPQNWRYLASRFVARNRVAVFSSALGLVALVGAFVATAFAYLESERQTQIAAAEAATAGQAVDYLTTLLGTTSPYESDEQELTIAEILETAKASLSANSFNDQTARAYIETALANVHDGRGEYEVALEYARAAVERLDIEGTTGERARTSLYALGLILYHNDQNEESKLILERTLREAQNDQRMESWQVVETETALAGTVEKLADEDGAATLYERALARADRLPTPNNTVMIVLLNNMGHLFHKQGRFEEAIGYYQRSLELAPATGGERLRKAVLLSNIAGIHGDQQQWNDAIPLFTQALDLYRETDSLASPNAIITRVSLANIQRRSGALDAAEASIRQALDAAASTLPAEHFVTSYVQNVAAIVYCDRGEASVGRDYAQKSLATREKILPPGHWILYSARSVLGDCETRMGNYQVARTLLTEALERLTELRGAEGAQTGLTRDRLAALDEAELGVR